MEPFVTTKITLVSWYAVPLVALIVRLEGPTGVDALVVTVKLLVHGAAFKELGVNSAVAPVGNGVVVTASVTVPVKPLRGATVFT